MKILLIEDNSSIRNILRMSLEAEGFIVDVSEDGEDGSFMARTNQYDMIILDNMLPKKRGKEVCKEIREAGKEMPVLILSAKSEVLEKVDLLNNGVDDYMTKPFSFEELLARIRSLIRRPHKLETEIITIENVAMNTNSGKVTKNNKELYLTRKEFSLLELLMKNRNQVVSRGNILEHVWNMDGDPFSNTIEAHILNLRKKLGDRHKRLIENVPGRGYRMNARI
ncbi:response regulator transcription factor [Candidatus Nomurabacteria bacterium]|nr:response regulator transcription factor [Candidatus Nomurabacteria bacterium]